jgi:hypothetical protein
MGEPQEAGKVLLMDSAYEGAPRANSPSNSASFWWCRSIFDKLDFMFTAFITVALVAEALRLR